VVVDGSALGVEAAQTFLTEALLRGARQQDIVFVTDAATVATVLCAALESSGESQGFQIFPGHAVVFAATAAGVELVEMWLNRAWSQTTKDPDRNPSPISSVEHIQRGSLPSGADLANTFDERLPPLFDQCQTHFANATDSSREGHVDGASFNELALGLLHVNLRQWLLEDRVRGRECATAEIAATKRMIDISNMARHEHAAAIDGLITGLVASADVVGVITIMNSETIGYLVDRLTIWSIKPFFYRRSATRDPAKRASSLAAVIEQRRFTICCYDRLLAALLVGRGLLPPSGHFKAYGALDK